MIAPQIRPAEIADAQGMADLQNRIIAIGGTTAYQLARSPEDMIESYIAGPDCLCCFVAQADDGTILGFQALGRNPALPADAGDIGTFVSPDIQAQGLGAQLFKASVAAAKALGLSWLNASIRADNQAGLAYYARRGFRDFAHDPDFALNDGRVVGKVHRRLDLCE